MKLLVIGNLEFQDEIRLILHRIVFDVETALSVEEARDTLRWKEIDAILFDYDPSFSADPAKRRESFRSLREFRRPFMVVSSIRDAYVIAETMAEGAADYLLRPFNHREIILRFHAMAQRKTRIACIGGGTGLFTLLIGLKVLPGSLLTSIVSMSDDGGSSGKLTKLFGILPPGDIRRSLVALSNAPDVMNQIMTHRFDTGGELKGHSFGNIFLTALTQVTGSMSEAVRALSDILNIQGIVYPVSRQLTKLAARFENQVVVMGETHIDLCHGREPEVRIESLWHEPQADCDANAFASIMAADWVIIGPGDLFTSVLANLTVRGLSDALVKTKAKKIYICNLMTKPGETWGFTAADHVRQIVKYAGKDCLDYVLLSNTPLSNEAIGEYAKKNQSPVTVDEAAVFRKITKAELLAADIGNETELVRHDSVKLKNQLEALMRGGVKKAV